MRWFSVLSRCSASLALLALPLVVAGCTPGPRRPVRIPDHRAYLLTEAPDQFDVSSVRGRRIVLDPGHGGRWPGAVGPNGVREADVNLGVGLHLWGLLKEAGAEVALTRTTDSAVSQLPEPTLKQDLQARAEFATEYGADLFISLHHNADIIPGSRKNDLETYYQLRDPGPSLDLVQTVHRHLARNLGQRPNAVLPGNFHVIRETAVPGILGEASYVSSEENEQHLAMSAAQRLEAEAYFLGIVEYFSRGVPRVAAVTPGPDETVPDVSLVQAEFVLDRGVLVDPGTIEVRVDGDVVPAHYDAAAHRATALLPTPLASGPHAVTVRARNVRGNATPTFRSAFTVDAPPDHLRLSAIPPALHPDGSLDCIVEARVMDAHGLPVLDGTPVTFRGSGGRFFSSEATTVGGVARAYWQAEKDAPRGTVVARVGDLEDTILVDVNDSVPVMRLVQVWSEAGPLPVAGALLTLDGHVTTTDTKGIAAVQGETGSRMSVTARGYWPAQSMLPSLDADVTPGIVLRPVVGGVLHQSVITVDAADGGAASGARGPTGLRAADVNLRVARLLADYIRSAGGTPVLTRSADATMSAFARVETSEAAGADRFIAIRHGAATAAARVLDESGFATTADLRRGIVVEHYPSSTAGRRLALHVRRALQAVFPRERARLMQSVAYELTHTACPAIRVQALSPLDPEDELHLAAPATPRRIAYAIFAALALDFGADPATLAGIEGRVLDARGAPVAGATARVNDLWIAVTDDDGGFSFALLPPGKTVVEVQAPAQAPVRRELVLEAGKAARLRVRLAPAPAVAESPGR